MNLEVRMSDFTHLKEEQIFGEKKLAIFEAYGTKCAPTDFSILLGGYVSSYCYTEQGNSLQDRAGWWWTQTAVSDGFARVVNDDGDRN